MTTLLSLPKYVKSLFAIDDRISSSRGYMDQGLPDYLVLDIGDLVTDFQQKWHATIASNAHRDNSFKPDMLRIVQQVINSIRLEEDAELELASMAYNDIAAMSHYEITDLGDVETYNRVHLELSNLTVHFGKAIITRFKQESIYHSGYLPYRFHGWVGTTVSVALDRAHNCSNTELLKGLNREQPSNPQFTHPPYV